MRVKLTSCLVALLWALSTSARSDDAAARGKYLAVLGDCRGCHTTSGRAPYSGGRGFSAQFGTVYSSNITPDRETGIGDWTKDQFYRALHEGLSADGRHLYPAFPYVYFTRITRDDSDALFAYLKTLKPVHAVKPKDRLGFPFNIRSGLMAWNALFLDKTPFNPDPARSPAWNRGAYIVNGLGHCGECHTPKNALFGDEKGNAFTGETVNDWFSANLTGSERDGLGKWSVGEIVQYLKAGRNVHAVASGSMQEIVTVSTSLMNDGDLTAIAEYLKSLPPQKATSPKPPAPDQMQRGQAVFVQHCALCHTANGIAPLLAGNTLVQGRKPVTVLKIVLGGSQAPSTTNARPGYSMPGFAALSDDEIADVATYIRNDWGNRASAVSAKDVRALR
jgi:mono/diheme cytochrome c family protein